MAFCTQLMLLLWKNYTYRRRQPIQLVVELLWPLFLFFILVAVRHSHPPLEHHECHFPNKPLPSAGTVPWLQGLVCNVNNSCFQHPTPGEKPGVLSNFKDSLISRLLADAHTVLGGHSTQDMLAALGKLIPVLRAVGSGAWPQESNQPAKQGSVTELLEKILQRASLETVLGQAQDSMRKFSDATRTVAQELLTLPSLVELRALLRRPRGSAGSLELISEALCSTKGPSSPGGLSLNWYEANQINEFMGPELAPTLPDSSLSPACSEFVGALDDHPVSRLLWRRLKPLILGKILFAPDTNFTRKLMAQVNQTFEELALLRDLHELWGVLGPQIFNFMNDSTNVAMLQKLLDVEGTGWQQQTPKGQKQLEAIRDFLDPSRGRYNWQEAHADMGRLAEILGQILECVSLDKLEAVPSEEALVSRALELLGERRLWAGIVFLSPEHPLDSSEPPSPTTTGPGHLRVKIRMDIDDVTRTNKIRDKFWDPGPSADPLMDLRYVWGGFVYLQDLLEQAAVRVLSGRDSRAGLYLQQMPHPCYVDDVFLRVLSRSLPLFLTLAWIYSVALTVKAVVREKETRLRETMRAMGLSRAVLWLGWFLSCLGPFLVSAALLVLVLKLGNILPYSHPVVVFLFLAAFAVATVAQSFLLSAFFSRANLAAACGGLAYFALYLPYVLCVAWRERLPLGGLLAVSLLSPVAFGFGCESLALLEEQGDGAQWHNLGTGPAEDVFSLAQVSAFLLLDAVIYGLALWYLEAVCPGQYGIPEPWNFPFRRSYWCGPGPPKSSVLAPAPQDPKVLVEEPPPGLVPGVSIRGLKKHFRGSPQPALRGLNLDFYEGHITAFLGHNGAGKTTTLSILSGLFPPSSGSASILGHDVQTNMAAIRPHLGICPQYNVLFDMLTVEEHVWFYGRLKGVSAAAIDSEQEHLIRDVGLIPKRDTQTRHLSGGMQRKLSVAIAFVGGSRVVIMDEPTAGVDPASRRGIWELLLKYREGRTLILSTHHLDEAELLGDRVAMVASGSLCCCGSPLFLRRHLGCGYYLTLVKSSQSLVTHDLKGDTEDPRREKKSGSEGKTADTVLTRDGPHRSSQAPAPDAVPVTPSAALILELVQRHVPGAQLVEELPHELVLALPYAGALDGSFATVFQELDQQLERLGLTGYGISDTNLEEIFLKVVEEAHAHGEGGDPRQQQHLLTATPQPHTGPEASVLENGELAKLVLDPQAPKGSAPTTAQVQGWTLTCQQLRALLHKRFLLARRSRRGLFAQIVLPALFVGLALFFTLIVPPFGQYPPLQLSPAMYGPQVSFFSEDAPADPNRMKLLEALLGEAGLQDPSVQGKGSRGSECTHSLACYFTVPEVPPDVASILASGNWTPDSPSPACQCSQPGARRLLPDCPAGAGGPPPPQAMAGFGEVVQNLTGRNVSDFLVKTYPSLVRRGLKTKKWVDEVRYGGFSLGGRDPDLPSGREVVRTVAEMRALLSPQPGNTLDRILNNLTQWALGLDARNSLKIWFNNKGWHAMVAFVNRANNGLLRAFLPSGSVRHAHSITTLNHPLNLTKEQLSEATLIASSVDVLVSICVVFAMSFVPASFTLVLIEERITRAKHLQLVSGLPQTLYWLGNFLWDMNLQEVSRILKQVFLIFPHFCLGRGLIDMVRNQAMADAFERLGDKQFQSPLRWDIIGKNLLAMVAQGPLFLLITLLLQHRNRLLPQPKSRLPPPLGEEDEDVVRERERVTKGATQGDVLVLRDLTKVYRGQRSPAVDHLCLGIPPGECFGLLGVNGAGKTSTFRMVTGDTLPSSGEAVLAGHNVAQEPSAAHRSMGYCPQSDAIFDLLTGREHLELFARLRGVPEAQVAQTALSGLVRLGLPSYADRPAGTYSGGNKRKLATALALVGDPAVVFLDEPTTGMDPSARRFLWNNLLSVVREGRSVVLTSHSMEECEALCTRLAIMVNGRFRCLGSAQHLKSRFGAGHTLTLRVPPDQPEPAIAFIVTTFPDAELREVHGSRLRFQLPPGGGCKLARVFRELAAQGKAHGVEDFSVSQTTLEEVFLYFSKDQGEEEEGSGQETETREVSTPGLQHPKRVSRFLEDPSSVETVI
ncbi:ATP-binding cassette sub-family A member 7 isoform X3 [Rattus norvegicus]|uniref:ATP-binding cassette sub-family A member 7 n=1 Tax=Rattus norvegicus TaxID=10116 RepID=A0A8I6A4A6_RAT|nr:ATP-binding cassette sub-family A member 7 isoform X3 [Rattus norvegicus]|eukprot:XP_017450204.1 PREDICTED: ATP-binding cassette sub-family A member 7 isoform X2 [Rattus norvegicus]